MADYIQQLNSLSSTSALSQLKLDGEGHLKKRNIFEVLGHKIADAFRSLSSAGRTAITARNGELLSAMQKAVDESKYHVEADVRTASEKLATTLDKLQNHINKGAYFAQIKGELTNDPRFARLPETSKKALVAALESMRQPRMGATPSGWKDCATALKWAFFGERPATLDMESGIKKFSEHLKNGFLKDKIQNDIAGGFNQLTLEDFRRNNIAQVGDIATPRSQSDDFYKDALRNVLNGHEELMPFVSTAIGQDGVSLLSQLLPKFSNFHIINSLVLCDVSANMNDQVKNVTIRRDGDILVVDASYMNDFHAYGADGKVCSQLSTVTMRIDLAAEPERHSVNGKEVLIPQFSLENVNTNFKNPVDIVVDIVKGDQRFKAMPERSQRTLIDGLNTICTGKGSESQKLDAMERLKNDFFGIKPSNYDMEKALDQFSTELVDFFLTSEQQKYIDDNGLHASFGKDAERGMFSIGDTTPPRNLPRQVYANTLMDWLPKQHHHFLPFISMMATQAGINSAKAFLPHMSGLSDDPNSQHLIDVGILANKDHIRHHVNLTLDGNTLRLTTIFDEAFIRENEQSSPPVLHRKGTATMTIDLAAEPRVETVRIPNTVEIEDLDENDVLIKKKITVVEHKEVLIPKFIIENGEVHYETPTA